MENPSTTSNLRRWINRVLIGLFFVLMWLPSLDSIFHFDWTPRRSENRAMAVFPKFQGGGAGVQAYLVGLEAYFNDHFGCRKCLVLWNNKLRWFIFQDRNSNVLLGKTAGCFRRTPRMVDHYSGQILFTPEQLHDWQVLLEKRRDWLAKRGIAYLFVVAPDKQTIYPEELPIWVTKVGPQTKLDQFVAYMHEHSTVRCWIYAMSSARAKNFIPRICRPTPTGISSAASWAYQEVVRRMGELLPALKLEPEPLSSFKVIHHLQAGGDIALLLGTSITESNGYSLMPKPGLPKFTSKMFAAGQAQGGQNTDNPQAKGRVLIFKIRSP
ncbi:MAG: alginate O-acetyltransferase [Limisphaerales bacterium]